MIDTVRLSVLNPPRVLEHKFTHEFITMRLSDENETRKLVFNPDKNSAKFGHWPRLTYYPGGNKGGQSLLSIEVSLPKFLLGNNAQLLNDAQIVKALDGITEVVGKFAEVEGWRDWKVSRLDSCYCWQVGGDVGSYIRAFSSAVIPSYKSVPYRDGENKAEGQSWINSSRRVNFYDKAVESGLSCASGLLRLEIQARNREAIQTIIQRTGIKERLASDLLNNDIAYTELINWLNRIGGTKEILNDSALIEQLIRDYGTDGASSRYFFIKFMRMHGRQHTINTFSQRTYERHNSEAIKKGWKLEGQDVKVLPALELKKI